MNLTGYPSCERWLATSEFVGLVVPGDGERGKLFLIGIAVVGAEEQLA